MSKSSKKRTGLFRKRTLFEWVILLVSGAAIATIGIGLLIYSTQFEQRPSDLVVRIEPAPEEEDSFLLTVQNRGGTTAEDVVIELSRGQSSQLVEFRAIPKAGEEEATVALEGEGEPAAKVVTSKES